MCHYSYVLLYCFSLSVNTATYSFMGAHRRRYSCLKKTLRNTHLLMTTLCFKRFIKVLNNELFIDQMPKIHCLCCCFLCWWHNMQYCFTHECWTGSRDEADEFVEIGALNGIFVLGRSMGFIGESHSDRAMTLTLKY